MPLVAPALLICAIAIRLDSPGPILFTQQRTGQHGIRFGMYKFRTMVRDAEALKASLMHLNIHPPPDFKIIDDPRITRVGRFLRKTSLDELPQAVNVLRGEMSLVGPRPTSFAASTYDLWHTERLEAVPGSPACGRSRSATRRPSTNASGSTSSTFSGPRSARPEDPVVDGRGRLQAQGCLSDETGRRGRMPTDPRRAAQTLLFPRREGACSRPAAARAGRGRCRRRRRYRSPGLRRLRRERRHRIEAREQGLVQRRHLVGEHAELDPGRLLHLPARSQHRDLDLDGVALDNRNATRADTLWDGTHLYVASQV